MYHEIQAEDKTYIKKSVSSKMCEKSKSTTFLYFEKLNYPTTPTLMSIPYVGLAYQSLDDNNC